MNYAHVVLILQTHLRDVDQKLRLSCAGAERCVRDIDLTKFRKRMITEHDFGDPGCASVFVYVADVNLLQFAASAGGIWLSCSRGHPLVAVRARTDSVAKQERRSLPDKLFTVRGHHQLSGCQRIQRIPATMRCIPTASPTRAVEAMFSLVMPSTDVPPLRRLQARCPAEVQRKYVYETS